MLGRYVDKLSFNLFLFCLVVVSQAATANQIIKACAGDTPPYSFQNGNSVIGHSIDLIHEVISEVNQASTQAFKLTIDIMPWSRCLKSVKQDLYDVAIDGLPRPQFLVSSLPTLDSKWHFVVPNDGKYQSYDDVKNTNEISIGLANTTDPEYALRSSGAFKKDTKFNVVSVANSSVLAKLIERRRVEIVVMTKETYRFLQHEMPNTELIERTLGSVKLYYLFNEEQKATKALFDQALEKLTAKGVVESIYNKPLN
ncbi:MAG: transporter substrate-binding domain-containing protein [Gammaproteobacteria bacterium]|nr:transporter substrate-binding domain-containing protein [Gammaproteobacteria bacterium]